MSHFAICKKTRPTWGQSRPGLTLQRAAHFFTKRQQRQETKFFTTFDVSEVDQPKAPPRQERWCGVLGFSCCMVFFFPIFVGVFSCIWWVFLKNVWYYVTFFFFLIIKTLEGYTVCRHLTSLFLKVARQLH